MKRKFWRKKTTPYKVGQTVRVNDTCIVKIIDIAPKGFWWSGSQLLPLPIFIPYNEYKIEEPYRSRVLTREVWHNRIPLPGETFRFDSWGPRRATAVDYRPWTGYTSIWTDDDFLLIDYREIDSLEVLTKVKYIEVTGEALEA